ncbi:restriction endonuclease subunit S [Microcystis aeruginosa]|uniref:Type I restriction modification DNA specificity protein n=1 Tax=Microcystis aeruginosa PCC 9808 TaxID=1160284 RepID=I4I2X2_MICAE|nr:restriction endonuclease subunit S [Microcystis aeruginosa]CCI28646.1 Type I restriction modification DNA specificity protein [Microcystis aeruginosa PCC 9808]
MSKPTKLPEGWKLVSLGEVGTLINGDRGKNYPSQKDFVDNGVPFINAGHIQNGEIDFESMNFISRKRFDLLGSGKVKSGDILYCLRGSLGKTAIIKDIQEGAIASSLVIIRPSEQIRTDYFYRYLASPIGQAEIYKYDNGSSQPNLSAQSLKQYRLPLPPLEEQRRIAAILDKADGVRRKRKEAIRLTEELLRSTFLEMFGDPVTNPKGWEICPMKKIVIETQYGTAEKSQEVMGGLPILRMNNITYSGEIDLNSLKWCQIPLKDEDKFTVKRGDLLFNRTNSPELVGKTAVWRSDDKFAYAGYLIRVRFDKSKANSEYVSAFLNSAYGKRYLLEKAKPSINMSNFRGASHLCNP